MTHNSEKNSLNQRTQMIHSAELTTKIAGLSAANLLRIFGAFAVIASLSMFTLQGWSEGNDIKRFLTLMSQTGLLVSSGFLLNWLMKERKGARMFFILALGSVLANVTILSALLYSFLPLDQNLVDYPDMMRWVVTTPQVFVPLATVSMLVLSGLSYFAFSILARPIAKPLTLTLIVLSTILLIPLREPMFAIALAAIALLIASHKVKEFKDHPSVFKTLESRVAFGMLYLPAVIIVARAVLLYPIDPIVFSVFALLCYGGLRYWRKDLGSHFLVEGFSTAFALLAAYSLGNSFNLEASYLSFLICIATFIALTVDQMRESKSEKTRRVLTGLLSCAVAPLVLLITMLEGTLSFVFIGLVANSSIVAINAWQTKANKKDKSLLVVSSIVLAATMLFSGTLIVEMIALGNWFLLGLVGVLLIFGSSFIEWYKNSTRDPVS